MSAAGQLCYVLCFRSAEGSAFRQFGLRFLYELFRIAERQLQYYSVWHLEGARLILGNCGCCLGHLGVQARVKEPALETLSGAKTNHSIVSRSFRCVAFYSGILWYSIWSEIISSFWV